ncbi:MAG: peptide-methionine (S)-S-oxide reductase MsrA [Verrucomicrobia bacterium]|jgi:methionine-S-sulfoxide reductase|nr:peptide-methionine (S)-S-oxide reductase MsrA [Verrucomicrobiota bacterium]
MKRLFAMGAFAALFFTATSPVSGAQNQTMTQTNEPVAVATLGGGCFWCTEAIYKMLPGVKSIVSGYAGGKVENPTYQQVCTGASGHAEVIQISYDPSRISYETILKTFWEVHDPTTLNQQGADIGTQYRSVIMFHDAAQKAIAEKSKIEAQKQFTRPIVTEIVPFDKFYAAEGYHQDYYKNNPMQGYCRAVIRPKVEKFEKKMKEKPAGH